MVEVHIHQFIGIIRRLLGNVTNIMPFLRTSLCGVLAFGSASARLLLLLLLRRLLRLPLNTHPLLTPTPPTLRPLTLKLPYSHLSKSLCSRSYNSQPHHSDSSSSSGRVLLLATAFLFKFAVSQGTQSGRVGNGVFGEWQSRRAVRGRWPWWSYIVMCVCS